jgi:hypothetical protein
MFGKKDGAPPEGVAIRALDPTTGPQEPGLLDGEVARLSALSLPELAAEVMTKAMSVLSDSDYPDGTALELFNLVRVMMPAPLRDEAESDVRLLELVGEGVQVLEQARLVRLEAWAQAQFYHVGYLPTRLGRAALEANAVDRIINGGSL